MVSAVIITPETNKDWATAFAVAQGWQAEGAVPGTFSVPLGTDGVVTHWGCRADVTEGFLELLKEPPKGAEALIIDVDFTLWGRDHWDKVLKEHGLEEVYPDSGLTSGL